MRARLASQAPSARRQVADNLISVGPHQRLSDAVGTSFYDGTECLLNITLTTGSSSRTFLPHMHKRGLCRHAVSVCLSVCHVVYSVKTSNHILKRFHRRVARPFWFFPNQTLWQYSDGNPLNGASNAGGVGKNRNSLPISGFIACCQRSDRQVLYTQLHRIVASW